jgi:hypothetical protein
MAKQDKVPNKVRKENNNNRNYKIESAEPSEVEIEIDLLEDGDYEVDKLETESLPTHMDDKTPIHWFNNFSIRQNRAYIKKPYVVRIPHLREKLKEKDSKLVIYSDTHDPKLYYYEGSIEEDTFELTDGDPAVGHAP